MNKLAVIGFALALVACSPAPETSSYDLSSYDSLYDYRETHYYDGSGRPPVCERFAQGVWRKVPCEPIRTRDEIEA